MHINKTYAPTGEGVALVVSLFISTTNFMTWKKKDHIIIIIIIGFIVLSHQIMGSYIWCIQGQSCIMSREHFK